MAGTTRAAGESDSAYVLRVMRAILGVWAAQLDARAPGERDAPAGRRATGLLKQCVDYMAPLLRKLRDESAGDITPGLAQIVDYMEQREYVKAHDHYLQLAIGNAAWPLGVTMVGIHERGGREKITALNVPRALTNEEQRKYLQSVKRILTFSQDAWSTHPSKMVR